MRTFTVIASLAVFFAGAVQAITPAATPQFEALFVGVLEVGDAATINNTTFGSRLYGPITGGNLTDLASGQLAGTVLAGSSDTGIISQSGIFFPDAVLSVRWEVDQKLAYLRATGVGEIFVSDLSYIHLETDSETYSALNSRFLLGNLTFFEGEQTHPVLTIYGAV
ncbi:hypothetical protein K466DRAFT_581241 [Polyporus arcularius HHB13444]|uniref:Uncharacterized protein n=1 Tax=Polyporus arcularius HHB13444 TaxID=1314778 RepID=A0A5C3PTN2_9APHY|nr:hypothetical protein K466DRAFT_581241 [Polyporus arcularius HHB13444]